MPDHDGSPIDRATPAPRGPHDDALVAAALRALPELAPQPDLWPDIARTLAARRRPPATRWILPLALAATLLLALLLPREATTPTASTTPAVATSRATAPATAPATDAAGAELDRLRLRSQTLERWIAAVAQRAPQGSRDLMAAVEVEDLIGLVDVQLTAASDAEALPLWRQRVALLEDLANIRGSAYATAALDDGLAAADASSIRIH